jgi:hypothetical protein
MSFTNLQKLTKLKKGSQSLAHSVDVEPQTVCFTDLGKLNLPMIVRFHARANYC